MSIFSHTFPKDLPCLIKLHNYCECKPKMSVVKVYVRSRQACLDLTVNFHHKHFIDPTNWPWVYEDVRAGVRQGGQSASFKCEIT